MKRQVESFESFFSFSSSF